MASHAIATTPRVPCTPGPRQPTLGFRSLRPYFVQVVVAQRHDGMQAIADIRRQARWEQMRSRSGHSRSRRGLQAPKARGFAWACGARRATNPKVGVVCKLGFATRSRGSSDSSFAVPYYHFLPTHTRKAMSSSRLVSKTSTLLRHAAKTRASSLYAAPGAVRTLSSTVPALAGLFRGSTMVTASTRRKQSSLCPERPMQCACFLNPHTQSLLI